MDHAFGVRSKNNSLGVPPVKDLVLSLLWLSHCRGEDVILPIKGQLGSSFGC